MNDTRRDEYCPYSGYVLWFFAGAAAGVAAGLLLAPSSGAQTRKALADKATSVFGVAQALLFSAKVSAESMAASCKEQTSRLSAAVAAGVEEARKIKQDMADMASQN